MKKADQILSDKMFVYAGTIYLLDRERTIRYGYAHSLEDNLMLFGTSSTGVKIQVSIHDCQPTETATASQSPPEPEATTTTAPEHKPRRSKKKP